MASRNCTLFLVLIVSISAIMAHAPSTADANSFELCPACMVLLRGTLYCEINVTLSPNGTALSGNPPPFPHAPLQLRCGNRVLANARTDKMGIFGFTLVPPVKGILDLRNFLVAPSSNCAIVVNTPLSSCNATLPSTRNLVSGLLPGTIRTLFGFLRIFNLQLRGFQLV